MSRTITKAEIIDTVATATGITKVDTEAVMKGIFTTIIAALKDHNRVELRGFGSFGVKKRNPRKARNPGTGEIIYLPKRVVPTFKPSRLLKELLNKPNL